MIEWCQIRGPQIDFHNWYSRVHECVFNHCLSEKVHECVFKLCFSSSQDKTKNSLFYPNNF